MVTAVGITLALVAAMGLAGQALFVRLGPREYGATIAVVITLVVNLVLFIPATAVIFYSDYGITRASLAAFAAAGLAGPMFGRIFFFASIHQIGASRAEVVKASTPLVATVLAIAVLGERLTELHFVGILLIVIGVAIVARSRSDDAVADVSLSGVMLALAGAFFFGIVPIFVSIGFGEGTPVLVGLSIKTVTASVTYFGYLLWRRDPALAASMRSHSLVDVKWYIVAGLAGTVFLSAYYAGLQLARVVVVVPIVYMSPLLVVASAALFFSDREPVTIPLVVSSILVISGGVLVTVFG